MTFNFLERGAQVRFEVEVFARGADVADAILLAVMADFLQDVNWQTVVERVVRLSGGRAPAGVQTLVATVDDEEARKVEEWAAALVVRRLRGRVPPGPPIDGRRRRAGSRCRPRRRKPGRPAGRPPSAGRYRQCSPHPSR